MAGHGLTAGHRTMAHRRVIHAGHTALTHGGMVHRSHRVMIHARHLRPGDLDGRSGCDAGSKSPLRIFLCFRIDPARRVYAPRTGNASPPHFPGPNQSPVINTSNGTLFYTM